MKKYIIKVNNMSYKCNDEYLFKDFNLEIEKSSFVSIVGPNGSGKTLFTKILVGLCNADGYVTVDGYLLNDFFLKKIRRTISLCNSITFIGETVKDDLVYSLENLEYSIKEMNSTVDAISKRFKIESLLEEDPNTLSVSEKAKVAIASSVIHNPKVLILDEIIAKLNPTDKKLVFKVLKEYQKDGITIILITNDLNDTLLSNRIIVLNKGKIIRDGSKEEIYKDDFLERIGMELPFIVKLSHNLRLYNLIDHVYFNDKELMEQLWG